MPELHIVTGAGPAGRAVAEQLAEAGKPVRVLTRSGGGPEHALIQRRQVDVTAPEQLSGQFDGATAVYHCLGASEYTAKAWRAELLPAEQAVLDEAGKAGTVVVFVENIYSYGRVDGPITETLPRTADFGKPGVRTELLRAREAHATATVSVAAADFLGPYVRASVSGEQLFVPILTGKRVQAFGKLDLPHSYTYIPDVAAAMIRAAADESLWNSVLHAPTAPPITQQQLIDTIASTAGVASPKVFAAPAALLRLLGITNPMMRELAEMSYQVTRPFVLDSTQSEQRLGLHPTPIDQAVAATVAWWKSQL
ncbi:NAD-dependent epimerase/dehydratase family protein [Nocardia sp. NBC_00565]|uniref:NAD-dependent epimerase/dehydratase family protein n=1 Tax=Nocardia sp. NBC_00565 TaxID=2975993 RepID=UPI002E8169EA|nr:NAD-dependent epimerase/dehydratase family protein [Nocardia sp. NBC_00565]WUC05883.1 NAD-dependent epimerase/dehydratase family protein [Nocardia sp. NBC_00565]